MKNNYTTVVACLFLLSPELNSLRAQNGPEFPDCSLNPISLCVTDEGVRLPANNKFYLGEGNPDATSCSVHVTQKTRVRSTCGKSLQYEVQIIMFDTSAPFVVQPITYVSTDSLGEAELSFDTELSPEFFIKENGIPYTSGCERYHRIKWIVTDSCGKTIICEKQIDLYDCFKPVYTFPDQNIHIQILSSIIHLFVSDMIIELKDDCTSNDEYLYSYSPDYYKPDSLFHLCDFPNWSVIDSHNFWIADKGRDLNCDGMIEWSERRIETEQFKIIVSDPGYIDCLGEYPAISGKIETEDQEPVEKVHVTLTSPGLVFPTYVTDEDGKYRFEIIITPADYEITPARNDNHKNGVSTLDLVKIQKHLLGIETISSPYDLIAADANNSQHVSAIDMLELRKLIIGIYTELPNNSSWRFVAEDCVFADPTHPWSCDESVNLVNVTSDQHVDFIAIKVGDVNGTVQPNVQSFEVRSARKTINLIIEQQEYLANELIEIDFSIDNTQMIQGFQFTISSSDLEFIDITSDMIEIGEENFALFGDKLTVSWFDEKGVMLSHGDKIFTLTARSKSDGSLKQNFTLNSDITSAEVYSMNEEILDPKMVVIERENITTLYSPQPNPWKGQTNIHFYLQNPGMVTFEIYDLRGRPVYMHSKNFDAGNNVIYVQSGDFNPRGVLLYCIKSGDSNLTNKMVVLE